MRVVASGILYWVAVVLWILDRTTPSAIDFNAPTLGSIALLTSACIWQGLVAKNRESILPYFILSLSSAFVLHAMFFGLICFVSKSGTILEVVSHSVNISLALVASYLARKFQNGPNQGASEARC
jgi:hypothetical protein